MMKLPTSRTYSRYQGVKWARDMLLYPQEYEALRATMFGDFAWDEYPAIQNGRLTDDAHPWLLALQTDLQDLFGPRYTGFSDQTWKIDLMYADMKEMRIQIYSYEDEYQKTHHNLDPNLQADPTAWKCERYMPHGNPCPEYYNDRRNMKQPLHPDARGHGHWASADHGELV